MYMSSLYSINIQCLFKIGGSDSHRKWNKVQNEEMKFEQFHKSLRKLKKYIKYFND